MNQESINQVLRKYCSPELTNKDTGVLRCPILYGNKPYQILYVDDSDSWFAGNMDDRIEKTIVRDYYAYPGSLQWNFYYAFLAESKTIQNHLEEKSRVEENRDYARKLVVTLPELDEWLARTQEATTQAKSGPQADLQETWISKLSSANLDCVFMAETYKDGVERYMAGDPIKLPANDQTAALTHSADQIKRVDRLVLSKYREHPKIEGGSIDFGSVNLITGVNATGKTSLMEAVELMVCGIGARNENSGIANVELQAQFNGNPDVVDFLPAPGNAGYYKQRDKEWYKSISPASQPTRIYKKFNRFNFFNSDAAAKLSMNQEEGELLNALKEVAMGEEINALEDRLKGFKDRFWSRLRTHTDSIVKAQSDLAKQKKSLKELGEIDQQPEALLKALITDCEKMGWALGNPQADDFPARFEKNLSALKYLLQAINSETTWLDKVTLSEVQTHAARMSKALEQHSQVSKQIVASNQSLKVLKSEQDKADRITRDLKAIEPYVKHDKIAELAGLKDRLEEARKQIARLEAIKNQFAKVDKSALNGVEETLEAYEKVLRQQKKNAESDLEIVYARISALEKSFAAINKLVATIKKNGRQFIEMQPKATQCPLCESHHQEGELEKLIRTVNEELETSENHEKLLSDQTKCEEELDRINSRVMNLEALKDALAVYASESENSGQSVFALIALLQKEVDQLPQAEQRLKRLSFLSDEFQRDNLTESAFGKLTQRLSDESYIIHNVSQWDAAQRELADKVNELSERKTQIESTLSRLRRESEKLLEGVGLSPGQDDELANRVKQMRSALEHYEQVAEIMEMKPDQELRSLDTTVNRVGALFSSYKDARTAKSTRETQLKKGNERIKELEDGIKEDEVLKQRAETAYNMLEDIMTNHSSNKFMEAFIENNRKEINDVFLLLHAPKEFKAIQFNVNEGESKGKVELVRTNGTVSGLLEISTGQRAAVALAIFFTMHNKLDKGPDLLLFDDPVAYVDDLNLLSFLDYLRELVKQKSKQVFFATASQKIAYLFQKKFDFMGDEFKLIALTR